jgi:hypothetical protein
MRKFSQKLEDVQRLIGTEQDAEKWEELYEKEFQLVMDITSAFGALNYELNTLPEGHEFLINRIRAQAECIIGERLDYT